MYEKNTTALLPVKKYAIVDVEGQSVNMRFDPSLPLYCICVLIRDENGVPSIIKYRSVDKGVAKIQQLLDDGWAVFAHNAKFDFGALKCRGLSHTITPGKLSVGCTMVNEYIIDSSKPSYSLDSLTGAKGDVIQSCVDAGLDVPSNVKDFWNTDWSANESVLELIVKYCVQDLKATDRLYQSQLEWLNANPRFIAPLLWMEYPMLDVLSGIESHGAYINRDALFDLIADLGKELEAGKEILRERFPMGLPKLTWNDEENEYQPVVTEYKEAGYCSPKNIAYYINEGVLTSGALNSKMTKDSKTKKLRETYIVYSHCKLVPYNSAAATGHNWWLLSKEVPELLELADTTKKGKPQLDKNFFEDIAEQIPDHLPIAKVIKMAKYLSMANGLLKHLGDDSRIHANFQNCKTRTTRLATSNPNLQNIARAHDDKHPDYNTAKDWGRRFRSLFAAPTGKKVLVADLDRIEIVVLAWFLNQLMGDSGLLEVVNSGLDVHQANADKWGISRPLAKTLIFLLVYGGTPHLIHKRGMTKTLKEAEEVFNTVNESQPSIAALKRRVWNIIRKRGYISNPFDAHGVYPELTSPRKYVVSAGERKSFNFLIQKTARDIITLLILESTEEIRSHGAHIVNIVHDEVMVEVDEELASVLECKLNAFWENRVDLLPGVRVNGTFKTGNNWMEAK